MKRIGIFSGSFDPVHKGHVAFAREAIKQASLDKVYFAPESHPRRKSNITHVARRLAMLKLAVENEPNMAVLELPDKNFSVAKTLPRLKRHFPKAELYYLAGSDMLGHMYSWNLIEQMLQNTGFIIGRRSETTVREVQAAIDKLPVAPKDLIVLRSADSDISSNDIRRKIAEFKKPTEVTPDVQHYIDEHWLYHKISD